jgi:hypothetical protein
MDSYYVSADTMYTCLAIAVNSVKDHWDKALVILTGLIVAVGIFQIIFLWRTVTATSDNVRAARSSTEVAKKGLFLLNRAYLTTCEWGYKLDGKGNILIKFAILNPSNTAARIETIEFTVRKVTTTHICGGMLTPQEMYWVSVPREKIEGKTDVIPISGRITYKDIFHKERHRKFAKNCSVALWGISFEEPEGVGLNDEEEWDKEDS